LPLLQSLIQGPGEPHENEASRYEGETAEKKRGKERGMTEVDIESYKHAVFDAAIAWQEACSKHGRGSPEEERASGYLYDRVPKYKKALAKWQEA
jgi:hypothetical protein